MPITAIHGSSTGSPTDVAITPIFMSAAIKKRLDHDAL
jgi:hypothetical protein